MTQLEQFKAMLEKAVVMCGGEVVTETNTNSETGDSMTSIIFKHHSGVRCQFDFGTSRQPGYEIEGKLIDVFVDTMPGQYCIGPLNREELERIVGPLDSPPLSDEELARYEGDI